MQSQWRAEMEFDVRKACCQLAPVPLEVVRDMCPGRQKKREQFDSRGSRRDAGFSGGRYRRFHKFEIGNLDNRVLALRANQIRQADEIGICLGPPTAVGDE